MNDQRHDDAGNEHEPDNSRLLSRMWRAIVVALLWRLGSLRRRRKADESARGGTGAPEQDGAGGDTEENETLQRNVGAPLWAERLIAALLALVPLAGFGFVALFVFDPDTQLLGICLAAALGLLAAAFILAGRWLVPQETKIEQRPHLAEPEQVESVASKLVEGFEGISRRRMLAGAAGVAGVGLGATFVIPVIALGPGLEDQLSKTPWHAGRLLVDEEGKPIHAESINERSFLTAFPQGANKDNLGSPIVVVRVDPSTLELPAGRAGWAPKGILAYSKICTHAGCAISLYRSPLSPSTQSRGPALVCPCHYSTFDVLDGAKVEFGPAGRPLPQLPLKIDASGHLRANGPMSGPVGPSWWDDPE